MEITEVKIFPVQEDKLKAFVSVVLDHCFMVNDIKIIQGRDGLFISMPSRKKKNGDFKDVAHPLNNEMRQYLERRVLGEYHQVLMDRGLPLPNVGVRPIDAEESKGGIDFGSEGPPDAIPPEGFLHPKLPNPSASRGQQARYEARREQGNGAAESGAGGGFNGSYAPAQRSVHSSRSTEAPAPIEADSQDRTLEEVEELHLRESFWSVP